MYDIQLILEELELSNAEKENLIKELKDEFPQDEMMFELHLLRAVQYLKKKSYREK